ncbi:MAG: formylglycine-generating enzyme family protein [Cyanobacteria bacterium P01_F01_bin.116]
MATPPRNLTLHRYKRTNQGFVEDLGNGVTMTLMLIPAGEFMMGAAENEPDSQTTERPQHLVEVPKFLMGKYPVTQSQWKAVAGLDKVESDLNYDPSGFKGDNRPVERVSWYDAVEFCKRLSAHASRKYGLPSEAEWEYACRAETKTLYHFGEIITTEVVNYCDNDQRGEYQVGTTPVNYFDVANAFGLCDMHGNVDEWCQDHWHDNYEQAPTDGSAWVMSNNSATRLLRGGSWTNNLKDCRSASRDVTSPSLRNNNLGFRIVYRAP